MSDHAEWLRKGGFPVPNDPMLDDADRGVLSKFGHWMEALTNGTLTPTTPDQERFLRVHRGEEPAGTPFEVAWVKLLAVRHAHAHTPAALRPGVSEPQLNQLFALLEGVRAEALAAQQEYAFRRLDVMAAVQPQLDQIDADMTPRLKQLAERLAAAELAVKQAVLAYGRTYVRGRVKVTYSRGRVTFDSKGLQEYAVTHPEVERFKKVGNPIVSIRYDSAGQPALPPAEGPEALPEADG
jgi:uncharacterized protein YifE (UPF0438 family)